MLNYIDLYLFILIYIDSYRFRFVLYWFILIYMDLFILSYVDLYWFILNYIELYCYIIWKKQPPCDAPKVLQRDLATNFATEPCNNLATYLATETLKQGDVCSESLAMDVAAETLRHPAMCQMAVQLFIKVMFHSMFQGFLATEALSNLATRNGKNKTCSESLE